ncbi:MAG: SRPBCC family protein [Sphingomonas sp.]
MADIERPAPDTIRFERLLDAPVETVWRYLTDAELRGQWFAAGTVEPREGGALELVFDHDALSTDIVPYPERFACSKGFVACETVVRFEPPRVFAFTFEGQGDSIATFELFPAGDRTRLVLTHSGISSLANCIDFGGGWHAHLAALEAKLAGGGVANFWALHARSEALVAEALGEG